MKYLIETTEVYRVDTEEEAKIVVEEAKKKSTVVKYNYSSKFEDVYNASTFNNFPNILNIIL